MIKVIDNFCREIDAVRESALRAGFGTWKPNKGKIGTSIYEGMNFWGDHSYLMLSLAMAMDTLIFPNSMFFRYTTPKMEKAYIHSDRETGAYTCVCYLTDHDENYGTAFYQHQKTGLTEMPPFSDIDEDMQKDIETASGFDQIHFVPGKKNRAVIFSAPLFHSRMPLSGIGDSPENARMVWACHFHTPESLEV